MPARPQRPRPDEEVHDLSAARADHINIDPGAHPNRGLRLDAALLLRPLPRLVSASGICGCN